jgi:hypothetical protein
MSNRLDRARDRLVDEVEQEADERDLDVAAASNLAHDVAAQDDRLHQLCSIEDDLSRFERGLTNTADDPVEAAVLGAGIKVDDAVLKRVDQLVDEVIEEVERMAIEESEGKLVPDGGSVQPDDGDRSSHDTERSCIEDGCDEPRERVVTLYGGVAPVCDEHAEERLEHLDAIDNTAYFKGEREEPITDPAAYRTDTDRLEEVADS